MVQTNLLKSKMVACGMGRKELAKAISCSESTLSAKMNGRRSFTTLEVEAICTALGIYDDSEKCQIFLHQTSHK